MPVSASKPDVFDESIFATDSSGVLSFNSALQ